MPEASYELIPSADGDTVRIHARGHAVLASPTINRGTAFTEAQRLELGLVGLNPTGVTTMDSQLRRAHAHTWRGRVTCASARIRPTVHHRDMSDASELLGTCQ